MYGMQDKKVILTTLEKCFPVNWGLFLYRRSRIADYGVTTCREVGTEVTDWPGYE